MVNNGKEKLWHFQKVEIDYYRQGKFILKLIAIQKTHV